jgi:hypothetical protein
MIDILAGKYQGKIKHSDVFMQNKALEKSLDR